MGRSVFVFAVLLAGLAAAPPARSDPSGSPPNDDSTDWVGTPKGRPEVPSESLPPNQAARDLERRQLAEYVRSQKGAAFFAYVPVGVMDRDGQKVTDPATGRQKIAGFCLVWRPDWVRDNPHLQLLGDNWYSGLSFRADPDTRTLTVYRVWVGDKALNTEATAPLLDLPRADWPCSDETWAAVLKHPERDYYQTTIVFGPPRGGPMFPQRSVLNPCHYTNGHRVPGCHD
jgi:hypothetical protein